MCQPRFCFLSLGEVTKKRLIDTCESKRNVSCCKQKCGEPVNVQQFLFTFLGWSRKKKKKITRREYNINANIVSELFPLIITVFIIINFKFLFCFHVSQFNSLYCTWFNGAQSERYLSRCGWLAISKRFFFFNFAPSVSGRRKFRKKRMILIELKSDRGRAIVNHGSLTST